MPDICIIGGCGHVGLPLGLAFALKGKHVVGIDLDAEKVAATNAGRMPFLDEGADEALAQCLERKTFYCTTDHSVIASADVIVTVIGTPIGGHLNPETEAVQESIDAAGPVFRDGQLFIIRSTVYPGTTELIARLFRNRGLAIDVAMCPERVAQGVALREISSLPQLVSGCTPSAERRAAELFSQIAPEIVTLSPIAAELTKLYNNASRYIQFAVANQFFTIANDYGVDFYEIHAAMTHAYPRAAGFPTAGLAAGPCLFKDTMQLAAFHRNHFFLGHAAMLVNEGLPNYLVERVRARFPLEEMTVGILGMTFKADCDDIRDSLAFKLRRNLATHAHSVLVHDPFLPAEQVTPIPELLQQSDLIVVATPHSEYRSLDFGTLPVVDVWNMTDARIKIL
ncbi:MAG TPA: nucleotide sugar dehydrogenase [Polyangiales bacterium]|nr:nucleotide sugar dehydrogenase [Polyangiales bacterium]